MRNSPERFCQKSPPSSEAYVWGLHHEDWHGAVTILQTAKGRRAAVMEEIESELGFLRMTLPVPAVAREGGNLTPYFADSDTYASVPPHRPGAAHIRDDSERAQRPGGGRTTRITPKQTEQKAQKLSIKKKESDMIVEGPRHSQGPRPLCQARADLQEKLRVPPTSHPSLQVLQAHPGAGAKARRAHTVLA